MADYTVTLTDTEQTAMEYISADVDFWISNAAKNRARIAIEEIIKLKNSLNDSLPEYKYSCQNCHTDQEHWQMVCNNCFQIDQIALKLDTSNKIKFLDIAK